LSQFNNKGEKPKETRSSLVNERQGPGISFRTQLIQTIFYKAMGQMEMLFNQNHPSAKNQQSQDQHPCSDCERTGAAALPDISAFANSQAASSARSIQIPFP